MAWAAKGIAVIDVETTGLDPTSDRVIEVAVVELDPHTLATRNERAWLIDPERDPGPVHVHGIDAAMLVGQQRFAHAADDIRLALDQAAAIAGYNVGFDLAFLRAEFTRAGQADALERHEVIDLWWRGRGRLSTACRDAGLHPTGVRHRALSDAQAAADLLRADRGVRADPAAYVAAS